LTYKEEESYKTDMHTIDNIMSIQIGKTYLKGIIYNEYCTRSLIIRNLGDIFKTENTIYVY
jgi:hypothetical protein